MRRRSADCHLSAESENDTSIEVVKIRSETFVNFAIRWARLGGADEKTIEETFGISMDEYRRRLRLALTLTDSSILSPEERRRLVRSVRTDGPQSKRTGQH
ncbi:hypothetical protein CH281_09760 [Rhodococcus sp. 06-221-2]|nr:hypothetical protein ASH04_13390 [Rhodococcus sp. Leaf233]OZD06319.1 hypothetical protein CH281_09760 [Rhodococcus sp. 06-221-2]